MGNYIQGPDGKFAGSIGDGKNAVPTPSDLSKPLIPLDPSEPKPTPEELWEAYKNRRTLDGLEHQAFLFPDEAIERVRFNHGAALAGKVDGWIIDIEKTTDGKTLYHGTTVDGLITYESCDIVTRDGREFLDMPTSVTIRAPKDSYGPATTHIRLDTHGRPHDLGQHLPAIESSVGIKYYRHGTLHRENGPAEISANHRGWFHNGVLIGTLDDATGTFRDGNGKKVTGLRLWMLKRNLPGWDQPNDFDIDQYFGA